MTRNTLKNQVIYILRINGETRNDDVLLTTELWKMYYGQYLSVFDGVIYVSLENIGKLPREDHIKRIRASIQNDEKNPQFLPTKESVAIQRQMNIPRWRSLLGYQVAGVYKHDS